MRPKDGAQFCALNDFPGKIFSCEDPLIEGIVDSPRHLFLLGPGDMVLFVVGSRSYPVRDRLTVTVLARLESGHICR